jgi:hypothetical protein
VVCSQRAAEVRAETVKKRRAKSGEQETMDIEQLTMDNAQSRMKKDFDSLLSALCWS